MCQVHLTSKAEAQYIQSITISNHVPGTHIQLHISMLSFIDTTSNTLKDPAIRKAWVKTSLIRTFALNSDAARCSSLHVSPKRHGTKRQELFSFTSSQSLPPLGIRMEGPTVELGNESLVSTVGV